MSYIYCKNCEEQTIVRSYEDYVKLNPKTDFSRDEYYGACSLCAEDDDRFGIGLIEIDDEQDLQEELKWA